MKSLIIKTAGTLEEEDQAKAMEMAALSALTVEDLVAALAMEVAAMTAVNRIVIHVTQIALVLTQMIQAVVLVEALIHHLPFALSGESKEQTTELLTKTGSNFGSQPS
jgi:hypothetical protein